MKRRTVSQAEDDSRRLPNGRAALLGWIPIVIVGLADGAGVERG